MTYTQVGQLCSANTTGWRKINWFHENLHSTMPITQIL